jgi:16S rRNA pseudouridine516 synthase
VEVELTLTEGRFHQVKRMFAHFGYEVVRLHRSRFGEYTLGELRRASGARRRGRSDRRRRRHVRSALERRE